MFGTEFGDDMFSPPPITPEINLSDGPPVRPLNPQIQVMDVESDTLTSPANNPMFFRT